MQIHNDTEEAIEYSVEMPLDQGERGTVVKAKRRKPDQDIQSGMRVFVYKEGGSEYLACCVIGMVTKRFELRVVGNHVNLASIRFADVSRTGNPIGACGT